MTTAEIAALVALADNSECADVADVDTVSLIAGVRALAGELAEAHAKVAFVEAGHRLILLSRDAAGTARDKALAELATERAAREKAEAQRAAVILARVEVSERLADAEAERDAALRGAAAMRRALHEEFVTLECSSKHGGYYSECRLCKVQGGDSEEPPHGPACPLATDAGAGWASPAEAAKLREGEEAIRGAAANEVSRHIVDKILWEKAHAATAAACAVADYRRTQAGPVPGALIDALCAALAGLEAK